MPQAGTPKTSARYESLDAWRGVACLIVVVYHATIFGASNQSPQALVSWGGLLIFMASKGFLGVTLFFVISGFCISATVDASVRRQTAIADYFRRRVRRIFPPFWVFVVLTSLGVALVHALGAGRLFWEVSASGVGAMRPPSELTAGQWLRNLTLTEIWLPGLLGQVPRYLEGTGHAWTLAYEEQFYVVCGLLLLAARGRMNRFFAGAVGVSVLTIVTVTSPVLRPHVSGLFLDGQWIAFACGIAVYYDRAYATPRQRWVVRAVLIWLLLSWLTNPRRQSAELLLAAGFALLLIGLQPWDAIWARARVPRLFWWCGTRCYSLYLVHWPITMALSRALFEAGVRTIWGTLLITLPLSMAVSLLAAWAFHAAVERRFLNRSRTVSPAPPLALPVEFLQA